LVVAWQIPTSEEAEYPVLYLAGQLLQQRLFNSPARAALGALPLVNSDFDGMLIVGCEAPNDARFDEVRKLIIGEVERLARPGSLDDAAVHSVGNQLDEFQKTDLDNVPLPPAMTRTMARANIELQRLAVEIVAGDFDAFLRKLKAVTPEDTTAAIGKWLSPERACVVEVAPENGG
jgi:hypothetical protein